MAKFLTNLSNEASLLFKDGKIEVKSGYSVQVTESDIAAGIFDEFVNKGLAKIVKADVAPEPMYAPKYTEFKKEWSNYALDADQASAYLASHAASDKTVAGKVTGFGKR